MSYSKKKYETGKNIFNSKERGFFYSKKNYFLKLCSPSYISLSSNHNSYCCIMLKLTEYISSSTEKHNLTHLTHQVISVSSFPQGQD